MSIPTEPGPGPSFDRPRHPGCLAATGAFLLAMAGVLSIGLLVDWRERERADESRRREAERLTAIYAALTAEHRHEPPDPFAENHRQMAGLLRDVRSGRQSGVPLAYWILLAVFIGGGLFNLASGVAGLRARARPAGPKPPDPAGA